MYHKEAKVGDVINYKNEFGELNLRIVGEFVDVSKILSSDPMVKENSFSLDDAEKIALITDNNGIQLSFDMKNGSSFVIAHQSGSVAAICKAEIVSFKCNFDTPAEQIDAIYKSGSEYAKNRFVM